MIVTASSTTQFCFEANVVVKVSSCAVQFAYRAIGIRLYAGCAAQLADREGVTRIRAKPGGRPGRDGKSGLHRLTKSATPSGF
jgi:hypothetical protein